MASIYNVTNHRLDGEMLRQLNDFSTDDYCGIVGTLKENEDALTKSGTGVAVSANLPGTVFFLGGGCAITLYKKEIINGIGRLTNGTYYFIEVELNFAGDNIITDETARITIKSTTESVDTYEGHTVWVTANSKFRIPLCSVDGSGQFTCLVFTKDKSSLESYLSARERDALKAWMYSTFTSQAGSSNISSTYGKVGNYNFVGDKIYHVDNTDTEIIENIWLTDGSLQTSLPGYTATTGTNNSLWVDTDGKLNAGQLPVSGGGTGASNKTDVKKNLGIFYGTELPNERTFGVTLAEGDLYFRILE